MDMIGKNSFFSQNSYMLEKAMDVSILRRKVIADNIANVDVPHFKRSEVSFEAELNRALDKNRTIKENSVPARMSDQKHIPFFRGVDVRSVGHRVHTDYLSTMRNDGNNVDIEHEMTLAAKNQLRYSALTNVLSSEIKKMMIVIRQV